MSMNMLPSSPSKRPRPVDWVSEWRVAKSETLDYAVKIRKLRLQLQELETATQSTREFLTRHKIQSLDEVEKYVETLENGIEERDSENAELCDHRDDLSDKCLAYQNNINQQVEQLQVIKVKMESMQSEKLSLESRITELQASHATATQQANDDARALTTKIEDLSAKLEEMTAQTSAKEAEIDSIKLEAAQEARQAQLRQQETDHQREELEQALESCKQEQLAMNITTEGLKEQIAVLVATLDEREASIVVHLQRVEELERSLGSISNENGSQQEYIEKLQEDIDRGRSIVALLGQRELEIESLELEIQDLTTLEQEAREETMALKSESNSLEQDLNKVIQENKRLNDEAELSGTTASERQTYIALLESTQRNLEAKIVEMERHNKQQVMLLEVESSGKSEADERLAHLNALLQDAQESLAHEKQQMAETEGLVSEKMDIICDLRKELTSLKSVINEQKLRIETHENAKMIEKDHIRQNEELRRQINAMQESNLESQQKLQWESSLRRSLQEKILEMKGTIRVFCRVRPLMGHEMFREGSLVFNPQQSTVCVSQSTNSYNSTNARVTKFSFDQVFDASSTNADIFQEVDLLIQSIFNGFSCCIFAYGQTGSGKSHTMLSEDGIIYRTISSIFDLMRITGHNVKFTIFVSFFEIYNEHVIDLVPVDGNSRSSPVRSAALNGIHEHPADNTSDLVRVLEQGLKNRAVGATKMNKDSSRSHTVYSIRVESTNTANGEKTNGKLNLIDLAGSERLDKSQVTGQQLKETQAINKSLSALGDVIHALGQRPKTHIPFRNSKLTHMLQDSLSGKSKTLMLVNVSPALSSIQETLTSLRFAEKVNSTKLRECTSISER